MREIFIGIGLLAAALILWAFSPFFLKPNYANYPPRGSIIVALGDSLTEGIGGNGKGYPEIASERLGTPIINAGRAGDTTADALGRLEQDVLDRKPDIVLVALGGNDALRRIPQDETFANLRIITERIQTSGAVTILVGVRGRALSDPYDERFERLAQETRSFYIPDILDGLFGDGRYMSDAVHPNARGYEKIADRITPVLQGILADIIPKGAMR